MTAAATKNSDPWRRTGRPMGRGMRRCAPLVWTTAFLLSGGAAEGTEAAVAGLYEQVRSAAVEVLVDRRLSGSGAVVRPDGLILTAAHVLARPGRKCEAMGTSFGRLDVEVVAVDLGHDLALLRLPAREKAYPHLPMAASAPPVASTVYLFGAPMFRHDVLLPGTVGRGTTTYEFIDGHFIEAIHVAGPSPGGTSGGPWVNPRGELIGVQSSLINNGGQAPVGLAIVAPLGAISALVGSQQTARTATMDAAVEELWGQSPEFLGKLPPDARGLVVRQLTSKGAADAAGVREWDLISAVDGRNVEYTEEFVRMLRAKQPGETITLSVTSKGGVNPREAKVTLNCLEQVWLPSPPAAKTATKTSAP